MVLSRAMSDLAISLWAANLGAPVKSLEDWLGRVATMVASCKERGSELVVMPEYACVAWLAFAPAMGIPEELAWLAERAEEALTALRSLARRQDIGLIAGTMPVRFEDGFANRAILLSRDGDHMQDKLALTPWERDNEGWELEPGRTLRVITWRGARIAITICLDAEVPALSTILSDLDVDLLVVPSMTSSRAGYGRVFSCAKARAVELACPVAAVGAVGTLALRNRQEINISGASLFIPCEPGRDDGVVAAIGPFDSHADEAVLHVTAPIDACRALRRGGAEVWPPELRDDLEVED